MVSSFQELDVLIREEVVASVQKSIVEYVTGHGGSADITELIDEMVELYLIPRVDIAFALMREREVSIELIGDRVKLIA